MKAIIKIEFISPIKCTAEELKEWINYELGLAEDISIENPLFGESLDPSEEVPFIKTSVKISQTKTIWKPNSKSSNSTETE